MLVGTRTQVSFVPRNVGGNIKAVDLNPGESHQLVPESCVAGHLSSFLLVIGGGDLGCKVD